MSDKEKNLSNLFENEFDFGQDLSFLDPDIPEGVPEVDFEDDTWNGFTLWELLRLKEVLIKSNPDLGDLLLAIKLQRAIEGFPL